MVKRGKENKITIVFSLVFACLISHGYADDHYNQRKLFYDSGKFEQAIEEFNKAIDLNPKDAIAYYHHGNSYAELGKDKKALEDYSQAIHINPVYHTAYQARGLTYLIVDKDELACIDFQKKCELGECEDLEFAINIDSCQKNSDLDKTGSISADQP